MRGGVENSLQTPVAVLTSLELLDTQGLALIVDVSELEAGRLTGAQASTIVTGNAA